MRTSPRARRAQSGVALMEALVAATIVGIALLFVVGLLAHEARLTARSAGQRDAVMLLEAALEGIRAGAVPLVMGTSTYAEAKPPWLPIPERRGAVLWIEVTTVTTIPDLYQVKAMVRYRAGRDILWRSVTTRMWLPP